MGQKKDKGGKIRWRDNLQEETKHGILAVIVFVLAIFFILASLDYAGAAGRTTFHFLYRLFGAGYFLFPAVSFLLGLSFLKSIKPNFLIHRLIGGLGFFFASLGLLNILSPATGGGLIGRLISNPLLKLFEIYISFTLLLAIIIIALMVMFDARLIFSGRFFRFFNLFNRLFGKKDKAAADILPTTLKPTEAVIKNTAGEIGERSSPAPAAPVKTGGATDEESGLFDKLLRSNSGERDRSYSPPPLELLEEDRGRPGAGDIKGNANVIKRTLGNFGIIVEMDEVSIGPSITRYALKPAEGVKLSKIVGLQNDLSLALAAHPLRIEAPIPGKSLVGIEIPNSAKSLVGLGSLIKSKNFGDSPAPLLVSLGRGITGTAHFADLARAPHILIAGATGSGKSVVIHTFITSLLYRQSPAALKFIMIDPKRVELTLYNGTPHLLTPVITNPKRAIMVLKWLSGEMERRYEILERHTVRDIGSYHKNIAGQEEEKMPYIVVIIDELADIMSTYPRELEAAVVRLAQMSRAVGIHLVLSTQRPSVEVITGLIKANVPSRIALQVASQIDSRTILDMAGAEKLLGAGDMLYLSGEMSKPLRLQSAFISENEVKKVVKFLKDEYRDELTEEIALESEDAKLNEALDEALAIGEDNGDGKLDDRYEEARLIVVESGKASASYLQRKMEIGYTRAARLLDQMEERGVIGPADGAKARAVYQKPVSAARAEFGDENSPPES